MNKIKVANYNNSTSAGEALPTAADDIVNQSVDMAQRITELRERVYNKLNRVMIPEYPNICVKEELLTPKEYPPLFWDIYTQLNIIASEISSIHNALDRTDL
jgi:hypothetical protein